MKRQKNKNVYLGRIIAIKQQRITKLGVLGKSPKYLFHKNNSSQGPKKKKGPIKTEEKKKH